MGRGPALLPPGNRLRRLCRGNALALGRTGGGHSGLRRWRGGGVGPLWRGIPSTCSCSQALELKPRGTHLFYFFPSGVCVSQSAATKLPAAPCRGLPGPQHSLTASPPGSGRQGCRLVTEARQGSSKTPSGCTPPRHTRTASLLAAFGVPPLPSLLHPLPIAGCCPQEPGGISYTIVPIGRHAGLAEPARRAGGKPRPSEGPPSPGCAWVPP